jgi:hypothetical protein
MTTLERAQEIPVVEARPEVAGVSQILDTFIVFNAEDIIDKFGKGGSADKPIFVDYKKANDVIYMNIREKNRGAAGGGAFLKIHAKMNDVIRWRESTLSRNAEYFALLYKYEHHSGDKLVDQVGFDRLDGLTVPLPDPNNPTQPKTQKISDYYWEAKVRREGTENYYFRFMLLTRNLEKVGFYYWDPTITTEKKKP